MGKERKEEKEEGEEGRRGGEEREGGDDGGEEERKAEGGRGLQGREGRRAGKLGKGRGWRVVCGLLCPVRYGDGGPRAYQAPQRARGAGAQAVAGTTCVAEELNSMLH